MAPSGKKSAGPASQQVEKKKSIEKVISKRLRKGKLEFLIRYAGSSADTWVTEEQLTGKKGLEYIPIRTLLVCAAGMREGISRRNQAVQPEEIAVATWRNGQIFFLVKFPGENNYNLVHHLEANAKWPQLVIKYYEAIILFRG